MDEATQQLITLLNHLLPGFLTLWVVYGLTSYPKPNQFERLIQALIYSFIINALAAVEGKLLNFIGNYITFGVWDKESEIIASTLTSLAFGLTISFFSNNDYFYSLARNLKLTSRTAFPSEWYGSFNALKLYVVLHLNDGRRIMGYPVEWPSEPKSGHFRLVDTAWLTDRGDIPLPGNEAVLINAEAVELVEFVKTLESQNESEDSNHAPAATSFGQP